MRWTAAQALSWIIQKAPLELKQWTSDMGPRIVDAQKELAERLAVGGVRAWGRKQPHGLAEPIPDDPFQISGLTVAVDVHGEMVTLPTRAHQPFSSYEGPRWHSIAFEAAEIERAWPKPPPSSVKDWMLREAKKLLKDTGQLGKQDDMVRRCGKETGCTKREALAAHKTLSKELRREVGNRRTTQQNNSPKNSG
jgi:hypothetical protein